MAAWIDAFLPTFGLIALGFFLRRRTMTDATVWAGLENLTFWVLLPSLLASSISTVKLSELPIGAMAVTTWTTLGLGTVSALILARLLGHQHPAATSVLQGGIRFNNYIAFAVSVGLMGQGGLAFAGVSAGLIVPFVQVVLTLVFVLGGGRRVAPLKLLQQIAFNPLIIGSLVGFGFATVGGLPPGLAPFCRSLGQASLALGLLCVGAGLVIGDLADQPLTQILTALQKLVAIPALTLILGRTMGLDSVPLAVLVLTMASPTAVSAYVMARAMGGDARLMAAMITLQHLAAIITMPLWALVLT